jgi:ammonia channel protein AmtB
MAQEYHQYKKWSLVSFCTGVIDGLVAITPAAGYVGAREDCPLKICTTPIIDSF